MNTTDLNGLWEFSFRKGQTLEEALQAKQEALSQWIHVPSTFDALPHYYCQRGCAIYSRTFTLEQEIRHAYLKIEGMGLRGAFFLDDKDLGRCALPYSEMEYSCGPLGKGVHRVTIFIDNNFDPEKMKLFLPGYDFYAFGGLYQGVSLRWSNEEDPLDQVQIRTLDLAERKLELSFLFKQETPAHFPVRLSFDGKNEKEYIVSAGQLVLAEKDLALWDPEHPVMHTLCVRYGEETLYETFGIRQISVQGNKILLNGREIYLKGFNRHHSGALSGNTLSAQEMLADLQHLKTLGANFIRGSHYPLPHAFLDLCDRMGFLVWEETLGWGCSEAQMLDREFIALQEEQIHLMIRKSFNHPSVVIFAFLNENASSTEGGAALCRRLAECIRNENTGRLVTFACSHIFKDRALEHMDLLTFNTYPGWLAETDSADPLEEIAPRVKKIVDHYIALHGRNKPILASEMGCCSLYGQHDEASAQWTEEFQAGYIAEVLRCLAAHPEICGVALWQMNDAKSFLRIGENIRGKPLAQNLAGVYDIYRRPKKAAGTVTEKFKSMP